MRVFLVAPLIAMALASCQDKAPRDNQADLEHFVATHKAGLSVDQWVETKSVVTGQWDRTALVFGYINDDLQECRKVVAGLRAANSGREYRCAPAQAE